MDEILPDICMLLISLWFLREFALDLNSKGARSARRLEGAQTSSAKLCAFGAICSLCVLVAFTLAEYAFGVSETQSTVMYYAVIFWLSSAFIEELVFRGYFVVQNRGRAALILSALFFSAVFTLAHPFFWSYAASETSPAEKVLSFHFGANAVISSLAIFSNSILFYFLRFMPSNKNRSLLPCIAAHFAYNLGVFAVKLVQGHVIF